MDIRHLRYFATVVQEGSVSRAAAVLSMTQPPLSAAIAQLERELGVRLLERHSRGVDATVAGQLLAREAALLIEQVEALAATVRDVGTGRLGSLSVAATSPVAWEILPNLLAAFDRSAPRDDVAVDTDVIDARDPEVIDLVRDRRADAGVLYCTRTQHLERLRGRDLQIALVHREPLVLVVPASSPLAGRGSLELAELGGERWIMPAAYDGFPGLATHVRAAWVPAGIDPLVRRTVGSLDALVRLVAADMGIGVVPASVRSVATDGSGVAVVRMATPLSPLEAAVVWRRNERPSPVLGRFLRAALAAEEPDRLGPSVSRHHVDG